MLPEMFCSAKDCARKPDTAVVRASKIPMARSPNGPGGPPEGLLETTAAALPGTPVASRVPAFVRCDFNDLGGGARWQPEAGHAGICLEQAGFAYSGARRTDHSSRCVGGGHERERDAVHAVAQPGRRRPVVEHVAEMAAAAAAVHLGARDQQRAVVRGG